MAEQIIRGKVLEMRNFLKFDAKILQYLDKYSVSYQIISPIDAVKDFQKKTVYFPYFPDGSPAIFLWNSSEKLLLHSLTIISPSEQKSGEILCRVILDALVHQTKKMDKVKFVNIASIGEFKVNPDNLDEFQRNARYLSSKAKSVIMRISKDFNEPEKVRKMIGQFKRK